MIWDLDCEGPDAFHQYTRTAHKQHRCCECSRDIKPGDQYIEFTGVWNHTPGRYRWCRACDEVRKEVFSELDSDAKVAFGDLAEYAVEMGLCVPPENITSTVEARQTALQIYGDDLLSEEGMNQRDLKIKVLSEALLRIADAHEEHAALLLQYGPTYPNVSAEWRAASRSLGWAQNIATAALARIER